MVYRYRVDGRNTREFASRRGNLPRVFRTRDAHQLAHTPRRQILYVVTGEGRAQREGEPAVDIGPGDVVYFAPGEKHWHGARPDTFMSHVAVNPAITTDGGTDWMEPVAEEEYLGRIN